MSVRSRNDFLAGNLLRQSVTEIFYTIQIALSNLDAWKLIAFVNYGCVKKCKSRKELAFSFF